MTAGSSWRRAAPLVVSFAAGVVWHAVWAAGVDGPPQWDSAATWEVARHLAAGDGAVTRAVWSVAWLPPSLEHPGDLHWMPLPSRVLVPAMWLSSGWRAAQAVAVLVAASWGPLGVLWGRRLGLQGVALWLAGLVAASGLGALPFLGVPDSVGLAGLLGGGALLAASHGRLAATALLCALFALTRNDGFLLGLACVAAFPGWRAVWPAAGGLGAWGLWTARGWWLAGDGYLALRRRTADAEGVLDLLRLADPEPLTLGDRALAVVSHVPTAILLGLLAAGVAPALLAGLAAMLRRRDRSLWPLWIYAPLLAAAVFALAPGVAEKGTYYRSLAALIPAVAALGMAGAGDVLRGLPRWMLPGVVASGGVFLGALVGTRLMGAFPSADDCGVLAEAGAPPSAAVLAYEPLHVTARCDRPSLQIPLDASAEELSALTERYGIDWVVLAPEDHPQEAWQVEAVHIPGFERVGERVLRRQ